MTQPLFEIGEEAILAYIGDSSNTGYTGPVGPCRIKIYNREINVSLFAKHVDELKND